jgi:hypothetical protein
VRGAPASKKKGAQERGREGEAKTAHTSAQCRLSFAEEQSTSRFDVPANVPCMTDATVAVGIAALR